VKALSDCRLLLVDDAPSNLDILVEGLKSEYKLSVARDGEAALASATRAAPDLVLLDIVMPGIDGYEVCRRLRARPETADVPIVFLSSLEDLRHKARGFEVGANDYLTKPFDLQEVRMRVRALLKAKCYTDAMREQLQADLKVAHDIQMGMIPQDFSELESRFGVELSGVLQPAREIGGDLYGAFVGSAGRLVVLAGDVSGKGIPASLFMVRARSVTRLLARVHTEPERILARLNDELSTENPSGMFVTVICARYDPATRIVTIANGGHCRPVLLRAGQAASWAMQERGTALGFEPGLEFPSVEVQLQEGDTLVLYTDGVTEAFGPGQDCYGDERLLADLGMFGGRAAQEVSAGLLQRVRAFADGAPQSDDIAILVLRLVSVARTVQLRLRPTADEVMRSVAQLEAFGREHRVDEKSLHGLALALEECASNIVRHAGLDEAREFIEVELQRNDEGLAIELRDTGPSFDPTAAITRERAPGESLRDDGGWGIELARHYTDEISYRRAGGGNVLRLSKRLQLQDNQGINTRGKGTCHSTSR
jgi:sigma-B regulation protein RsbU (phosphoserine phosphatase)